MKTNKIIILALIVALAAAGIFLYQKFIPAPTSPPEEIRPSYTEEDEKILTEFNKLELDDHGDSDLPISVPSAGKSDPFAE